jgi:hypothetical protein
MKKQHIAAHKVKMETGDHIKTGQYRKALRVGKLKV